MAVPLALESARIDLDRQPEAVALICRAGPGDNEALVASEPERFFLPKYMAHHGWIGLYLDLGTIDWDEVRELATDAYMLMAPRRLANELDRS